MANVSFIRGESSSYDKTTMKDAVYFASDSHTILMGNREFGSYPKDFYFTVSGDCVEKKVLCNDVNLNLQPYSVSTDIDFSSNECLQFDIDLSTCSQDHNIELISIGSDISTWSAFEHTLRFFYSHNKEYQGNNNITMIHYGSPKESGTTSEILSTSDSLSIKISKDGIFINGVKRGTVTKTVISDILSKTHLVIGSARTDDSDGRCDALYKRLSVYKELDGTEVYMSYKKDDMEPELKELPLATSTQNGIMGYEDKQIIDSLSSGIIDLGTF